VVELEKVEHRLLQMEFQVDQVVEDKIIKVDVEQQVKETQVVEHLYQALLPHVVILDQVVVAELEAQDPW
jgi:hypothetical protein